LPLTSRIRHRCCGSGHSFTRTTFSCKEIKNAGTFVICDCDTKVEGLTKQMQDSGASVCSIRGNMPPLERAANMDEFRRGASRLLITTDAWRRVITSDVWSGGIDFKRVKVVINYDLPRCRELYVERFGISSRFDSRRVAISLVTDEAMAALQELERHFSTTVRACWPPL
jgi:superfamily II DNA/RNA helicase